MSETTIKVKCDTAEIEKAVNLANDLIETISMIKMQSKQALSLLDDLNHAIEKIDF